MNSQHLFEDGSGSLRNTYMPKNKFHHHHKNFHAHAHAHLHDVFHGEQPGGATTAALITLYPKCCSVFQSGFFSARTLSLGFCWWFCGPGQCDPMISTAAFSSGSVSIACAMPN